ncbi:MAG: aminoacyl-histidine dipeptidase [Chlorobiaceae bacterium]|nr:aminoacyl-histidine dipeptidase [Chlorobiaceae bacterium]
MSVDILLLEPKSLWNHFFQLTRIPRPSGYEAEVRMHVAGFGRKLGFETIVDEVGNVIIRKPATPGMEDRRVVVLQAHLDMVPQKNGDTEHDFEKDPIGTLIEDGWVKALGTTLGADNGIGMAAALAVLESDSLRHGPLEVLFTVNEEAGMTGAMGLKPGVLRGEILLNLDSEDEGVLSTGCAGGLDGTMTFSYTGIQVPPGCVSFEIRVSGLKGGHSGMDINLGRGNANKIMNRLLQMGYERYGVFLASIDGGSLRNAIPRESSARLVVSGTLGDLFLGDLQEQAGIIGGELEATDPGLRIEVMPINVPDRVIEEDLLKRLLEAVAACPDGVIRLSGEISGLVETSNNLARVRSDGHTLTVECLLRSAVKVSMQELAGVIGGVAERACASVVFRNGYPGWRPDKTSPILKVMTEVYRERFGRSPEIRAVHAGLECGIIGAAYPGLDMISFGPTIRHPHSPDEKVECASVGKFMDFLVATLAAIPVR